MNIIQIKKFQKNYHVHSPHVHSFNFKNVPAEFKNDAETYEEFVKLPIVRNEESRVIWVNESMEGWNDIVGILVSLDNLPELILRDLLKYYVKRFGHITIKNSVTFNAEETLRRSVFCFVPEILWTHGDDEIKSKIFL